MKQIRVPIARFKYNMRPYVNKAKSGETVVVTCEGKDEFEIKPCEPAGKPPGIAQIVDPKLYAGIDLDAPAFAPWK